MNNKLDLILVNLEAKTKLGLYKKQRDYMIIRGRWVDMQNLQKRNGVWSVEFKDNIFEHLKALEKLEKRDK